jgi:Protein of unknown function
MDRKKTIEIHKLMLDAVEAHSRVELAIGALERGDRAAFAPSLGAVSEALHSELLAVMYRKYPDLRPPSGEHLHIISTLRWDEVSLPPSISVTEIDQLIFSFMKPRWQKTAMVVGNAFAHSREIGLPISDQVIAARIEALTQSGRIKNQGDVRKWRHREMKL